ncbi:MAG: hypothetical protein KC964_06535, partial [Candidatus Omnitrophica bacterium]|nr:hypothetical protein [Candidatus Omnitrophota bacterium]
PVGPAELLTPDSEANDRHGVSWLVNVPGNCRMIESGGDLDRVGLEVTLACPLSKGQSRGTQNEVLHLMVPREQILWTQLKKG